MSRPTSDGIPEGLSETSDNPLFGEGTLWVDAWWTAEPMLEFARQNSQIKYASFTTREGKTTDELGPPQVLAKRLDGMGAASGSTGGYATDQDDSGKILQWWPTVIDFSSPGCWEVTETVARTSITYVIKL